jgi:hypothetical protein
MGISIIEVWNMLGAIPKYLGIMGPLVAAIICIGGARSRLERWTVMVLGLAALAVPVYSLYTIREGMMAAGSGSAVAVSAGLAELLVMTPFVIAGGLAAALVWQSRRVGGPSKPLIYTLTSIGIVIVIMSTTGMRSFVEAASQGSEPRGIARWIMGRVMPTVSIPTTEQVVGDSDGRVRTASLDDPDFRSSRIGLLLGRMDIPEEDSAVAILSPSYARVQGDVDMIGRTIVLDGRDFTVIGVLTEDADRFPVDVWFRESPNRSAVAVEPVTPDSETPYFEFQVEKPVTQDLQSPQPLYPDVLRDAGIEGEVLAQFVVDTVGFAEPGSLKILQASHDLFAQAVTEVLPRLRFVPAVTGGRKVKQFVQQPFVFSLRR